jgi:hypothetical protein
MTEKKICFKCGTSKNVINHHTSYNPPIAVKCCRSCHRNIHLKVRKENKCPLSPKEIQKISTRLSLNRIEYKEKQKQNRLKQKKENDIDINIIEIKECVNNLFLSL